MRGAVGSVLLRLSRYGRRRAWVCTARLAGALRFFKYSSYLVRAPSKTPISGGSIPSALWSANPWEKKQMQCLVNTLGQGN